MTFIVNGEEVEYLHIEYPDAETTVVSFKKKIDIATAYMGDIMEKLRKNGLNNNLVFRDKKHGIITITFRNKDEIPRIIHLFRIPPNAYEIMVEDERIIIDIPLL